MLKVNFLFFFCFRYTIINNLIIFIIKSRVLMYFLIIIFHYLFFFLQQDPLSHRIIEKRRRDRMNSCLADLSRLIPPQYLRKGRGRVEKTEIIEMAIRHLKHLQNQECLNRENVCADQFRLGYQECLSETARFLTGSGYFKEIGCKIIAHLEEHCNEVMKGLL